MEEYIQVITTTTRQEEAVRIATTLVEKKLAACVQVLGPMTSVYRWQGKVEQAEEWQCLIKSRMDLFPDVERNIKALHPYEIPEIIATPLAGGSEDYLRWLSDELEAR